MVEYKNRQYKPLVNEGIRYGDIVTQGYNSKEYKDRHYKPLVNKGFKLEDLI